jgi:hypothetical protein
MGFYSMTRSNSEKDIPRVYYRFLLNFAECSGWNKNPEKEYIPEGVANYVCIRQEEVQAIITATINGLKKIDAGESLITPGDDKDEIAWKKSYMEAVKTKEWRAVVDEMVAYLSDPVPDSYGLHVSDH